jgi:hypothetical protein
MSAEQLKQVTMGLVEAITYLKEELTGRDTAAAKKRARKLTLEITKLGKDYRALSTKF